METMLPMTAEAIKITEKKMSMTLDDIIKMSKKCSFKARKSRSSRRGQRSGNRGTSQGKSSKVQRFLDSRTAIRQELLSQRRLNPKGKGQPPMAEYAWSVAVAPVHDSVFTRNKDKYQRMPRPAYGPFQMKAIEAGVSRKVKEASELRPGQTLDSLFANMKTQRMRTTCRRQMQQAQPLGVRAIEGQRRARGIRKAEGASFTNRTEQKCAGWLASFTV